MKPITIIKQTLQYSALASSAALLASCAATQTAIEHRNLETNTQLSKTIFLDPVANAQKTIFIAVKNTSKEAIDIAKPLANSLNAEGYRVVTDPNKAHYLLQANILKVGKMSMSASQAALGAATALPCSVRPFAFTGNGTATLAGGVAGGLLGLAADSLVKEVNYTMVTDLQISEQVGKGTRVREHTHSQLSNGTATQTFQTSSKASEYQRYRARIVSNADKVNLKFAEAKNALEQGLVKAIAGIF